MAVKKKKNKNVKKVTEEKVSKKLECDKNQKSIEEVTFENSDSLEKEENNKKHDVCVQENETKTLEDDNIVNNKVSKFGSKKKWIYLFCIIILSCVLGIMCFPRIILKGDKKIIITYRDSYVEPGYNGYCFRKDITDSIVVNNNIIDGVVGDYEINYYIDWFGLKIKKNRIVSVVDNVSPVINTESDVILVCPNQEEVDVSYEALDEYEGDITSRVEKVITDSEVLLNVGDLSNNFTSRAIKIDRTDNEKPNIKLNGKTVMYLTYGSVYSEPGYSASDNCSGDITDKVVVSGTVSRNIGTYELKYEVEDDSGNKTSVIRKVIIGAKVVDNGNIKNGTIYLTFDDGPSYGTTDKILDILKSEGVKATFFVTCNGPDNLIKRMYDEGHTIALHTASHNYAYIYSSVDNYFADLNKVSNRVKRITGIDSKIIRFPGGSSNTISRQYSIGIMTDLTNIVLNQGYRYFDWNVDAKDASFAKNSNDVYYYVTAGLSPKRANVVLMHDTKSMTVYALKDIITFGKNYGYTFSTIDMNTYMVRHGVSN